MTRFSGAVESTKHLHRPIRSMHQGGSNSTEQPSSLQDNHCHRFVVEGEEGRIEGHIGEGTPAVEGNLVEGTPEEGKRPWDTPPEDNLEEVGHRRGVVAGCSNSWFWGVNGGELGKV